MQLLLLHNHIVLHKTKCFSSSVEHRTSVHHYKTNHSFTSDAHKGLHPRFLESSTNGIFPSFALFHAIIVCRKLSPEKAVLLSPGQRATCIMHRPSFLRRRESLSHLQFSSSSTNGHP
ncbi:hypothetical protein CEXT_726711 [Caerostris extrusa]|uniref:Uncharacterized protein n=1 Tax=Caerostris extrusa TaxID=172846 RepID=A0AAV4PGM7_CAEEX|nr:hypothetical protein CEXT_726711 [Caerostris extrusa]